MVEKYYFQSLNGSLVYVCSGDISTLKEKIAKEYDGDKKQALANIDAGVEAGHKACAELEAKLATLKDDDPDYYRIKSKIFNFQAGFMEAQKERERVEKEGKPDLVFFEMTPVEL